MRLTTKRFPLGREVVLGALAFLSAAGARSATMADVDRFLAKATVLLKSGAQEKEADKLSKAINACKVALMLLEKVPGMSGRAREKKATDIMATIYWCRKMMPLDLTGLARRTASGSARSAAEREPSAGAMKEGDAPASKAKMPEYDKIAFERARAFARANPDNLNGILLRFEGVAATYPKTGWGLKASQEAQKVRKKLLRARETVLASCKGQIQKLEFADALTSIKGALSRERDTQLRRQLEVLKGDVLALRRLWEHVVKVMETQTLATRHSLEELGVQRKGFLLRGSADHVQISSTVGGKPTKALWKDLGATAVARLGEKLLNLRNRETVEEVAIGATIAADWMLAHRVFRRLMAESPQRMGAVAAYFERAATGYRLSAEGDAQLRFDDAKKLVRKRKFAEAMAVLNSLRKDLARSSALEERLTEVNRYRRDVMRRGKLNGEGKPLKPFEKLLRRVFGGEVALDKETGAIEVLYDFSESGQLRDWLTVRQLGVRGAGWRVSGGKVACSGADTLLMWKFPIKSPDFQADLTFDDPEGRALFSAKMTEASPKGVLGWMRGGYLGFISGTRHLTYRRTADPYYIWRKGETATIRYYARGDSKEKYFEIELNGERLGYTFDIRDTGPRPGRIAFGFEKSRGTVDNVLIRGTLDMEWFSANVKGVR